MPVCKQRMAYIREMSNEERVYRTDTSGFTDVDWTRFSAKLDAETLAFCRDTRDPADPEGEGAGSKIRLAQGRWLGWATSSRTDLHRCQALSPHKGSSISAVRKRRDERTCSGIERRLARWWLPLRSNLKR